ncbi:MAG: SDR family oxidoreductase [Candidatus Pacebacteria bacterium]|nr:SDR family oxidoreductase [Candidatus Paceibacterota bacterium]
MNTKYAVITGGAGALGSNIAKLLIKDGCEVFILDKNSKTGIELEKAYPKNIHFFDVDVVDPNQVDIVVDKILSISNGEINYLVNTVGYNLKKPVEELSFKEMQDTLNVTVLSHAYLVKKFSQKFSKEGSVVNTSSVHSLSTRKNFAMYAAGKGAVNALTRGLALELRDQRIRVNAIVPGAFTSEQEKTTTKDWKSKLEKRQMFEPIDMANVVIFLLSEKSKSINGECIVCDGGVFAKRINSSDF